MGNSLLSIKLNTGKIRRALEEFIRVQGPKALDKIVRKSAFDVVRETAVLVTTDPKRVDSGRYRAAWAVAGRELTGRAAAGLNSVKSQKAKKAGGAAGAADSSVEHEGTGLVRRIRITNNVEYGPHLELGTRHIPAGRHVSRAVTTAEKDAEKTVKAILKEAWKGNL